MSRLIDRPQPIEREGLPTGIRYERYGVLARSTDGRWLPVGTRQGSLPEAEAELAFWREHSNRDIWAEFKLGIIATTEEWEDA